MPRLLPNWTLVSDVSHWGLLRWPARTRRRLVATVALATCGAWAASLGCAHYVLHVSGSVGLNVLLISATLALMLVVGYLQAVLVGDWTFAGAWRERVILGHKPEGEALDASMLEDRSAEFILILLVLTFANIGAFDALSGSFFARYHHEGFFLAGLRAEAPQGRMEALRSLADPLHAEAWERLALQDAVRARMQDADAGVREWAAWTAGHIRLESAREDLLGRMAGDEARGVRVEAAIALAKLPREEGTREAIEEALRTTGDVALKAGLLKALGLLGAQESVPLVLELTEPAEPELMVHAWWVIAQTRSAQALPRIKQALAQNPQGQQLCAVMDAMKMVAGPDEGMWARREFQRADRARACEHVIWEERDGKRRNLAWGESMRVKLLKTVANADAKTHQEWFQRLVNDPEEDARTREVANEVLKQLARATP